MDDIHMLGLRGLVTRDANVDRNFNVAAPGAPLCIEFGNVVCQQFGPVPRETNNDRHHYNALVTSLAWRPGAKLQLNASYTFSKAYNLADDSVGIEGILPVSDPFNFRTADRGPALTDQRQRFTFTTVVNPGRVRFLGGGWEIASIFSYATPLPFDIVSASPALDGISVVRPPGITRNMGNRGSQTKLLGLINAYRSTVCIAPGNCLPPLDRKLIPHSMNTVTTDVRVSKLIPLRGRFKLRLQAEAFNSFNHPNFISNGGPGGGGLFQPGTNGIAESDSVGLPRSTPGVFGSGGPRSIQLAVRLQW